MDSDIYNYNSGGNNESMKIYDTVIDNGNSNEYDDDNSDNIDDKAYTA